MLEQDAEERRRRGVTFRELAAECLSWLEDAKGAKPSTLPDHRFLLAEPGRAYRRASGSSAGLIMAALGSRPAQEVTTRDVEDVLRSVAATGVAPRTVNKVWQLVCAIFSYRRRPTGVCPRHRDSGRVNGRRSVCMCSSDTLCPGSADGRTAGW
jgi:hypothetical protein